MTDNAPFYHEVADGPDGGTAHWLKTNDGVRIRVAHWPSADARGTVLLFPGRTEYVEKYGRAAADFQKRGYATLAIDWRGQGLSDRLTDVRATGHVAAFRDFQRDVAAALTHAQTLDLPQPFYLVAHSMGGCIGLRALLDGLPVKAAAFSAPMWGIQMAAVMRPFAWGISAFARHINRDSSMAPGQEAENYLTRVLMEDNTLTNDPEMFSYMKAQITAHPDLGLGGPSLRWLNEALMEMRNLARLDSPMKPCLTFLGTDETIVDPEPIRTRIANWPGSQLDMIENGKHETMMDRPAVRDHVFDSMTKLFDEQR